MTPCTCCGVEYDADGFYCTNGEIVMPCKICRCDQSSIYYYNHAEEVRTRRRNRYYADLAASRAKDRNRKRQKRIQPAQISVL